MRPAVACVVSSVGCSSLQRASGWPLAVPAALAVRAAAAPHARFSGRSSARCHSALATSSYDAVVVGAGCMGSAIALELGRKGWRTLTVDSGGAAGFGSTSASCGIIRTMYSIVDSVKLAYEGQHVFERWADHIGGRDELGPAPYTRACGVILRSEAAKPFLKAGLAAHDALGIPYEIVDNAALQERFPWIDITSYGPPVPLGSPDFGTASGVLDGAVLTPTTTGYVSDTALVAHNLQRAAEAHGCIFRFNTAVKAVLKSQGRASGVRLSDGSEVSAPVVINAGGPWSCELNKLAFTGDAPADDATVQTRPMRVEVAYPQAPPELDEIQHSCWIGDFDTGVYFRTATGGRLCIGSVEPACDIQHDLASPDDFEDMLGEPWERQVYRAALRIPTLPIPNSARGVSHMYDKSDDFVPIYDRTALAGFYSAKGTSGNQFKNCGVVGQLMAHLVEACENGHDHDASSVRFTLPLTQEVLNLGSFSRLRGAGSHETTKSVFG